MGSYRNSVCKSAFFGLAAESRPRLGSGDFGSIWEAILLHRFAFLAPLFQEPPSARIWRFSHQFPCSFWLLFSVPCTMLSTYVSSLAQALSSGLAWLFRVAFDTQFRGHFWCYALEFLLRFWTLSSGLARLFKGLSSYIASWPRPCYF